MVIPSKGRARSIRKRTLALFPEALVCVDELERDEYAAVVPAKQLILHPGVDQLPRLSAIRNWILDHVPADALVMADDDISNLSCFVGWSIKRYGPGEAAAILESTAQCARDAGAGLFGFAQSANPALHFKPFHPFVFYSWVGSVIGFIKGHGLRYDEALAMHDDVDICLQSFLKHRIIWLDNRFFFQNARLTNVGGLSEYRSSERYLEEHARLKKRWGQYVAFTTRTADPGRRRRGLKQGAVLLTKVRVRRRQTLEAQT